MSAAFRNSNFDSDINRDTFSIIPSDFTGGTIEIQFPTQVIGAGSLGNNQTSSIQGYSINNKSLTQSYKSTVYVEGLGTTTNTLRGLDKVYPKQTVDNDLKSKYVTQAWKEIYNKSERIAKDGLRETDGNTREDLRNAKEVERYFQQAQSVISARQKKPTEKFKRPNSDQENDHVGVQNIHRSAVGETGVLDNRANIRTVMGNRSMQNQERIKAENDAKARLQALKDAQKSKMRRHEEVKAVKFADNQNPSNSLIIPDTEKLKKAVNNDAKKNVMKENEKKNSKRAGQNEKKSLVKKASKTNIEAPRASSAPKKKPQQAPEEDKKYVFSAKKIKKLPGESQADYKARFNYTVMAQPNQKENLDPFEQHQITKKFHEMILKSGVEKNGRITLDVKA